MKGEKYYDGNILLQEHDRGFYLIIEDKDIQDPDLPPLELPLTVDELESVKRCIEQWEFKNKYEKANK